MKQNDQTSSTPYQHGTLRGTYTRERIAKCGFTSARAMLAHLEQEYLELVAEAARIKQHNPEYGLQQEQFIEGMITATRRTLGALIGEEEREA